MANLNNPITKYNLELKQKAKELSKKSPDLSKLVGYRIDEKTIIYFKPNTSLKVIKRKLELYKKSLRYVSDREIITHGDQL